MTQAQHKLHWLKKFAGFKNNKVLAHYRDTKDLHLIPFHIIRATNWAYWPRGILFTLSIDHLKATLKFITRCSIERNVIMYRFVSVWFMILLKRFLLYLIVFLYLNVYNCIFLYRFLKSNSYFKRINVN